MRKRIWTVSLVAIITCAPAFIAAALLSSCGNESARRSVVADTSVSIAQPGRGSASPIHSSAVEEKPDRRADILWKAICQVESGGDPNAYNEREQAAGIGQIRPILVRDVCRIVGVDQFSLRDRFDPDKSKEMFGIYIHHYGYIGSAEEAIRIWNGGPRGMQKQATVKYWRKVQAAMENLK